MGIYIILKYLYVKYLNFGYLLLFVIYWRGLFYGIYIFDKCFVFDEFEKKEFMVIRKVIWLYLIFLMFYIKVNY